jgi:amino acid transporter/nucleotide-binding universal stress UspA family protein
LRGAQVIIVSSVMFTFISYWRTAAVVLCDLASTAYYIGGIVEQAIGPAAPWFILAVMLFSYAVRSVYIESCSLFVRGGVYRVVKEAMGGFLGKLSVSALMFDYILTGPTSGVSAGQYIMGLILDSISIINPNFKISEEGKDLVKRYGAVLIACAVTLYFFRQNLLGIHESSGKALKIMVATTVMAGIIILWCALTLLIHGPVNSIWRAPDLSPKVEYRNAAYFKLTKDSFEWLEQAGVPAKTLAALGRFQDKEFKSQMEFDGAMRMTLGDANWKRYQAPLRAYAKEVDDYEWTTAAADTLQGDVPDEVLEKLQPMLRKEFATTPVFETRLAELLTPEELAEYKYLIMEEAANTKVVDRVTGERRTMWARDPQTGELLPKLDKHGNPRPKINKATGRQEDPRGFLASWFPSFAKKLAAPGNWLSIIGIIGLFIAFGHSILAMSGEETLAQVYREVESPKLPNFKKAAFIVFVYSLGLTATISFLAVALIPDEVRMKDYSENLIGGLAMYVWGHPYARLALNAFVVVIGFLILSGAVNTAIIGSNGVLNRVAEDGVLPDWFLKPHPRYGTTYRLLYLIVGLQLFTILVSRGDMLILGEAYAFGVVWSFVFKALAMVVLRFKDRSPREYKVPFNVRIGNVEVPIGLSVIFLILLFTALMNFFTKEVATIGGMVFTVVFLLIFLVSEHYHEKRRAGKHHEHLEQFNRQTTEVITPASLGLSKPYRKLVSIRSTLNLFMLEKALAETDPETTDVIVMTAKVIPPMENGAPADAGALDTYDQQLMTAVVERAEKAGKHVVPLIVPTNNPLHAILTTAKDLQVNELILGASNKYTVEEQLDQIDLYWITLHDGNPAPLTVRLISREFETHPHDLAGGNRIPKISERRARSVAELRAAGVGVDRVLLLHDGTPACSDLFQAVLTMIDPQVVLGVVPVGPNGAQASNGHSAELDEERARQIGRALVQHPLPAATGPAVVGLARERQYDLIIVPLPAESPSNPLGQLDERLRYIIQHAHCRVFLATAPVIPQEVVDSTPSA